MLKTLPLESGWNDLRELTPVPEQSLPIDEEGGGAGHPGGRAAGDVHLDPGAIGPILQRGLGVRRVESQAARDIEQPVGRELLAAGEQQRMRLPELAVRRGELREIGGKVGARMNLGVGKMAPDQPQPIKAPKQGFDRPLRGKAMRTAEVPVLDQGELSALSADDVIPIRDRS